MRKAKDKDTEEVRAIKTISRDKIKNYKRFINEVNVLKTLDHPNIIKLFEVYEDKTDVHLVTEYWSGGELFDHLLRTKKINEKETAKLFRQIVYSVIYCHKNAICHRDLKPENFMFESDKPDANLKLIDFGLSCSYFKFKKNGNGGFHRMKSIVGTAYFIAPEVIGEDYTKACDMWSIGVILYIMLSGFPPFDGKNESEIIEAVKRKEVFFNEEIWGDISKNAQDLISKLLVPEEERILPKDVLKHPWLQNLDELPNIDSNLLNSEHIQRLKKFQNMQSFKKLIITFIATRTTDIEVYSQMQTFRQLDKNKDGYITPNELKERLKTEMDPEEVNEILNAVDTDQNGAINYTEFIAATMDRYLYEDKKKLHKMFKLLNINGDGKLSPNDIKHLFKKDMLQLFDDEMVHNMIKQWDYDNDGFVTFDEFYQCISFDDF